MRAYASDIVCACRVKGRVCCCVWLFYCRASAKKRDTQNMHTLSAGGPEPFFLGTSALDFAQVASARERERER